MYEIKRSMFYIILTFAYKIMLSQVHLFRLKIVQRGAVGKASV